MNLSPHELDMLITGFFVFALVVMMVVIVLRDMVVPSNMSRFSVFLIAGILLTAPLVFFAKNIYVAVSAGFSL